MAHDRPQQRRSRRTHVPALDGVRAVAVAAVLAFHGGLPGASGGFLGVDAFFVLSGYLITALLLAEWTRNDGRIDLAGFWGASRAPTAPGAARGGHGCRDRCALVAATRGGTAATW